MTHPEPLARTLAAAEAAAEGLVTVRAARLDHLEAVERAAQAEKDVCQRQEQHEKNEALDIDEWCRLDWALYRVRRAAYEALHAALAARPAGAPTDGD